MREGKGVRGKIRCTSIRCACTNGHGRLLAGCRTGWHGRREYCPATGRIPVAAYVVGRLLVKIRKIQRLARKIYVYSCVLLRMYGEAGAGSPGNWLASCWMQGPQRLVEIGRPFFVLVLWTNRTLFVTGGTSQPCSWRALVILHRSHRPHPVEP